jgi:transcriptional regulator with XRE-family HTH domain
VSSSFHIKRSDDIEELIPCGAQDSQKSPWPQPGSLSDVSSRTYMSSLERGLKSPTLSKVAELCEVMDVHPLTLLTLAYGGDSKGGQAHRARAARTGRHSGQEEQIGSKGRCPAAAPA